jgi:hypothetical protein
MTAERTHLVVVLLALTATGCQDPYARPERPAPAPATTTPVTSRDTGGAKQAARIFASRWTNWDWRTAGAQQRALALLTAGKLAADLRANAGSARIDAGLARDKPSSRGDVVATDLRVQAASATGIVVTRERTYTAGHADLGGQHYRVYRVRLTLTNGHWEVSSWERLP